MRVAAIVVLLSIVSTSNAQNFQIDEPIRPYSAKKPSSAEETNRRQSLYQYALALLCERDDRLLEALRAYEESARLDPKSAAPIKAQIPLLVSLERTEDARTTCRKVLDLDGEDFEVWNALARLYRSIGNHAEAAKAFRKGLATARIAAHPEATQQMYHDLGQILELEKDYGPAADAYRKAAEILDHPDVLAEIVNVRKDVVTEKAADTYERIGNLYRLAKKYDDALTAYHEAEKRAPDRSGRLAFHLAQIYREQGDDTKAVEHLDSYLRIRPIGLDAYEMKIGLLEKLSRRGEIVPWLEQAAKIDVNNHRLQLLLGREYQKAGQLTKAESLYKAMAATSPSPEVYQGLFRLYQQTPIKGTSAVLNLLDGSLHTAAAKEEGGAPANPVATAHARAMVGAVRQDAELARELVQTGFRQNADSLKFETLHLLAVLADRQRKADEAERFYKQCLTQANPNNEALIYGGLLRVLLRAKKYDEVIRICEQGLRNAQATNRLIFFNDKARAQAAKGHYDSALQTAQRGFELAGDSHKFTFQTLRIRILAMAEQFEKAETECQELLKTTLQLGDILDVRYLLSNVYSQAKKHDKSEEQLGIILRIDPNNATANNDLGYLWADRGKNLAEAEEMIRKALDLDRRQRKNSTNLLADEDHDNAAYVDSLAWVLFRRGQADEARKELERAAALPESEDPVIYDHLGDVYMHLRQPERARTAWQKAAELFDQGARRRSDERYLEIQRKLREVNQ